MERRIDRASPGNESAGHDGGRRETGHKVNNQGNHFGGAAAAVQDALWPFIATADNVKSLQDRLFLDQRAKLGLRGFTLARTDGRDGAVEYVVGFRGIHKVLRTLGAVEAFARQIGAAK